MIEILVFFLGVALFLYVLLGGADFGAGIVEAFTGQKSIRTISKAIAPIWEANHIWIILAIVILFNGFPKVYTTITTYLHIPLLIVLIGIIIRGTSFTFRYYDIQDVRIKEYYSRFFRISSVITPFFLGVVLGAVILGRIPSAPVGSFYQVYIHPWMSFFSFCTGIFVTLLFAWLASVFLIGENGSNSKPKSSYSRTSILLFILLIISGIMVFGAGQVNNVHLIERFGNSIVSLVCLILATLFIPVMWKSVVKRKVLLSRISAGIITFCILLGWFAIQFPTMVYISDENNLTIWNSAAPTATIKYLVYALIVGIIIIFPSIFYLYKVFKFNQT
jgi:cytochrome d ubiquinol oxidase subunit II